MTSARPGRASVSETPARCRVSRRKAYRVSQVPEHEVLARAKRRQHSREQQPEQFKHALSIADLRAREDLPPHSARAVTEGTNVSVHNSA